MEHPPAEIAQIIINKLSVQEDVASLYKVNKYWRILCMAPLLKKPILNSSAQFSNFTCSMVNSKLGFFVVHLDLQHCRMFDENKFICLIQQGSLCHLKSINLWNANLITDYALMILGENCKLDSFLLSDNFRVSDSGVRSIIQPGLRKLGLERCKRLRREFLENMIEMKCNLTHLMLKHQSHLSRHLLCEIVQQSYSTLQELHLLHIISLDDGLLWTMAHALGPTLRTFSVSISERVSAKGVKWIATWCQSLTDLLIDSVDYEYYKITNREFVQILGRSQSLRRVVVLGAVDITPTSLYRIRRVCPSLESLGTLPYRDLNEDFQSHFNQPGLYPYLSFEPEYPTPFWL